jgi:4-hydroxy-4-methyl-2-oxoglutarate aldolase
MTDLSRLESIKNDAYSAVFADILDDMGRMDQSLDAAIRQLWPELKLVGTARTVRVENVASASKSPYEVEFDLVDNLNPGEVIVAQCGGNRAAFWGELLTMAAQNRGAHGAVIDGYCRDTEKVREMGFPVFARGTAPTDSKGRLEAIERDVPIRCGGIPVETGDLVFGDADGIVVVPRSLTELVIDRALEKVNTEKAVLEGLKSGMSAREAWDRWGVL